MRFTNKKEALVMHYLLHENKKIFQVAILLNMQIDKVIQIKKKYLNE